MPLDVLGCAKACSPFLYLVAMSVIHLLKASAGAGKTYRLAYTFIRLALQSNGQWQRILAVTFTNKSTREMKERILSSLRQLALEPLESPYFKKLCTDLKLPQEQPHELQNRSLKLLQELLQDYGRFHVLTLDSFMQRMLRSLAREIDLSAGYAIEMDRDKILSALVQRLMDDLSAETPIAQWLNRFAADRLESEKSWDFRRDLMAFSGQVLEEKFQLKQDLILNFLENESSMEEMLRFANKELDQWTEKIKSQAEYAVQEMDRAGFEIGDFAFGNKGGIMLLFKALEPDVTSIGAELEKARVLQFYSDPEAWFTNQNREAGLPRAATLCQAYHELFDALQSTLPMAYSCYLLKSRVYELGLITEMIRLLGQWRDEENKLSISDAAPILNNVMAGNNQSFIFEKWGNYFDHFLIDEFQDTSGLQWSNLKPLVENGLAQGKESLLVGDVKQAIYRFRNGDWKLLHETVALEFGNQVQPEPMNENYRSLVGILDFNRAFFEACPGIMADVVARQNIDPSWIAKLPQIYQNAGQNPGKEKQKEHSGLVQFNLPFLSDLNAEQSRWYCFNQTIDRVRDLLDNHGYLPGHIAFLFRDNDSINTFVEAYQERKMAEPEKHWPDISTESAARLQIHPAVVILLGVLHALDRKPDAVNLAQASLNYRRWILQEEHAQPLAPNWDADPFLLRLKPRLETWRHASLADVLRDAAVELNLFQHEAWHPFIKAFLNLAAEWSHTEGGNFGYFLDWWSQEGDSQSLGLSDDPNNMIATTIHKSKGLEFDVVLVPYLGGDVQKYNDLLWAEPNPRQPGFPPLIPVPFSGGLKYSFFRDKWEEETLNQWLDTLNLLYVTFTRPRRMLEVWSPLTKDNLREKEKNYSRISSILLFALHALQPEVAGSNEGYTYTFGSCPPPEIQEKKHQNCFLAGIPQPAGQRLRPSITILGQPSEDWEQRQHALRRGLIVHRLAAGLDGNPATTEKLLKGLLLEGLMEERERPEYQGLIETLLGMPLVQETFDGSWKILNEQAILLPDGRLRRPDRVAIRGNEVRIIDYKTGSKKEEHQQQIQGYMRLLQQMGMSGATGYLVYLDEMTTVTVPAR